MWIYFSSVEGKSAHGSVMNIFGVPEKFLFYVPVLFLISAKSEELGSICQNSLLLCNLR